jgi:L-iditol 2-dehydrogenase
VSVALPTESRAAVLTAYAEPLELREIPVPREIEPGALLVEVEVTTICGTDVHLCAGKLETVNAELPIIPGHEFVGRIVAMGAGADRDAIGTPLAVGDRIVWEHEACGACPACSVQLAPELCPNRRYYMFMDCTKPPYLVGGFSQYCYVFPKSGRLRVPDEVDSDWAAASSCALRTVMHAFERLGRIAPWETVAIQGTGPLGLFAILAAKRSGARSVIAIGGPQERLDLARDYGADELVGVEGTDPESRREQVLALTGTGPDVVMEFSGAPGAFSEGLGMLRRGGRYVVVGQVGGFEDPVRPSLITTKQATVIGSWSASIAHYWQALEFLRLTAADVDYGRMISGRFGLEDATLALQRMSDLLEIKAAIYPSGVTGR